jgi:hypothetical protein
MPVRQRRLATPIGGTDDTRRLAAFLLAVLQPTATDDPWITLGEAAKRVTLRRGIWCSPSEVRAALRGDSVPAPEIIESVIDLRIEKLRDTDSSVGHRLRSESSDLRSRALASQTLESGNATRHFKNVRKRAVWAAGVAIAALISLMVTGVLPAVFRQIVNGPKLEDDIRGGPAIIVRESLYYPDGQGVPLPWVVPGHYMPSSQIVQALSRPMAAASPALIQSIRPAGSTDVQWTYVRVVLQGNRNEQIRILNIEPVQVRRTPPINGTFFDISGQGATGNIDMAFKFDQPVPQALNVTGGIFSMPTSEPYFEAHSISLINGEQVVLVIGAESDCYDSSFKLAIYYVVGGSGGTEIVSNNGRPFQVTGYRLVKGSISYRHIYVAQGNFSVTPVTSFPATVNSAALAGDPSCLSQ